MKLELSGVFGEILLWVSECASDGDLLLASSVSTSVGDGAGPFLGMLVFRLGCNTGLPLAPFRTFWSLLKLS